MAPSPKELQQLAKLCRKLGIKNFKCQDFEFTLDDNYKPQTRTRRSKSEVKEEKSNDIEELNPLTDEELLFWSSQTENLENIQ